MLWELFCRFLVDFRMQRENPGGILDKQFIFNAI